MIVISNNQAHAVHFFLKMKTSKESVSVHRTVDTCWVTISSGLCISSSDDCVEAVGGDTLGNAGGSVEEGVYTYQTDPVVSSLTSGTCRWHSFRTLIT